MHRLIAAAFLLLLSCVGGTAVAQVAPHPTFTGTITGPDSGTWSSTGISATGANVTGAAGFQQYGTNAYNQGVATVHTPMFIGPGAGHSYPLSSTGSAWTLGVGFNTLYSLTIDAEDIAIGADTGEMVTTAPDLTAIGVHAVGQELTQGNIVAVGDDAFRNSIGSGNSIGLGSSALRDGAQPFDVGIGTQALHGNSSTLTLGGTATNGDTIAVTVTAAGTGTFGSPIVNLGTTVPCTITTGESLASMTTCLQNAITTLNVADAYWGMGASAAAASGGPTNIISLDFPGSHTTGWQLTFTPVITGSATETITVGLGSLSSSTIAIGEEACSGFYTFNSGSGNNICIGPNVMPFYTTAQQGIAIGGAGNLGSVGFNIKNDSGFTFLGSGAGYSSTGQAGNTCIGFNGCAGAVSGGKNTEVGWEDSSGYNCITTGGGNLELGADACVASATASWQLSIMNAIYGANNSGQGTLSTGCIGFYTTSCSGTSTVVIAGPLLVSGLTSDAGKSDATVCDVTASGTLYYGSGTGGICLTTSSARFKTDIAPEREGLTQLMALHPVGFNYRPGHGYDPAKRYNGFIAEQMAPVLPELVGHDDAGLPNSVDLMGLVPILVQSVQQQQREIWILGAACLLLALWCSGMTVVLVRRR